MERPIEARVGSSVELECRAEGIPTPQIRWRRPAVSKKLCFLKFYNNSWYYEHTGRDIYGYIKPYDEDDNNYI